MGLLSFFTRKASKHEHKRSASSHKSHVATAPHRSRGTSPSGRALDEFNRTSRRHSRRLSVQPPVRPYYLGVKTDDTSRHSTASFGDARHSRPVFSSYSHRESMRGGPSFAFPNITPKADAVSPPHVRPQTSASARPGAFVDLLDAQGAIRPPSFKSRVAASGVRDYGEDVAERNLGHNLAVPPASRAQSLYGLADWPRATKSAAESHRSRPSTAHGPYGPHGSFPPPIAFDPRRAMATNRRHRTMSLNSTASLPFLREELSLPETATNESSPLRRSGTVSNSIPSRHNSTISRSPPRPPQLVISSQPTLPQLDNDSASPPPIARYRGHIPEMGQETCIRRAGPPPVGRDASGRDMPSRQPVQSLSNSHASERLSRRQNISFVKKIPSILGMVDDGVAGIMDGGSEDERCDSPSSPRQFVLQIPASLNSTADMPPAASQDYAQFAKHQAHERSTSQDSGTEHAVLHPGARNAPPSHSRARSMSSVSAFANARLHGIIEEHVPFQMQRMSSWRQKSVSSMRPTTASSDRSDGTCTPSRGYHTANTSIDLSFMSKRPGTTCSYDTRGRSQSRPSETRVRAASEATLATRHTSSRLSRVLKPDPEYNSDNFDAVTTDPSDIDDFIEKQLAMETEPEDEGETLFANDSGCFDLGKNLPGLFDCGGAESPVEIEMPATPTEPVPAVEEIPIDEPEKTLDLDRIEFAPMTRGERLRMLGYDYESDESESDYDIPQTKNPARPASKVFSTTYKAPAKIELSKSDIRAAIKLRKDAKRQKRTIARPTKPIRVEDDGNVADME